MALTGCPRCLKYLLVVFNIFFGILGCAILLIGVLAFVLLADSLEQMDNFAQMQYSIFAIMFVAAGVICILSMCICGCCGALKEHKLFLILYFIFLFVVFAFFLGLGIYIMVMSENLNDVISDGMKQVADKACNGNEGAVSSMKSVQGLLNCCGADGAKDYATCGNVELLSSCNGYTKGCSGALSDMLNPFVFIPACVTLGIAGFILPGMIISLVLFCAVRRNECD